MSCRNRIVLILFSALKNYSLGFPLKHERFSHKRVKALVDATLIRRLFLSTVVTLTQKNTFDVKWANCAIKAQQAARVIYIAGVRAKYLRCPSSKNRHSENGRVVSTKGCVIDTRITG
jgi:hypothetical protein